MPFSARSAATIRDTLLSRWRARYAAMSPPRDLSVVEGSEAYALADALAHELCGVELGAQQSANRVLVRSATSSDLDRFIEDDGGARKAATTSRLVVHLAGGPTSATTPVNGATMSTAAGARFTPIDNTTGAALTSIDTDGAGAADITVEAVEAGAAGNLVAGTVLAWSSAPTGFSASGTVASTARAGTNAESDAALRQRVLERMREKPGGFNRSQVREIGFELAGVGECFVYPRARGMLGAGSPQFNFPGVLTVLPVNPAPAADSYVQSGTETGQGLSPSYSRVPDSTLVDALRGYFLGTVDALGVAVASGQEVEKIPATLLPSNLFSLAPLPVVVDVSVRLTLDPSLATWPWGTTGSASREVTASSTTWVDLDSVSGIANGSRIAVKVGTGYVRGGWWLATVASVVGSRVTFVQALPHAAIVGAANVRPDPGLWSAVRAAVLALFDSLGPGDARDGITVSGGLASGGLLNVFSGRYPRPTAASSPETLFQSRVSQVVQDVDGVLGVTVDAPAANKTPAPGYLIVPGEIIFAP